MLFSPLTYNQVMLDGLLRIDQAELRAGVPQVLAWLQTDTPENGGRHAMLLAGDLAVHLLAAWVAADADLLEATVRGQLETLPDGQVRVLVADLALPLAPAVAERAAGLLVDRAAFLRAWFPAASAE